MIPRWPPLRRIFARFSGQLLKDLVFWGSHGDYSMIDRFSGDAFTVLSHPFWNTLLQCGARLPIHMHLKLLDRVVNGVRFLTGAVLECDIAHRRSVAVYFVCCIRSGATYKVCCNPVKTPVILQQVSLFMMLYPWRMRRTSYSRCFGRTSWFLCASALHNIAVPVDIYSSLSVAMERSCWPCIRWCMIGGFQKQGPMLFL